MIEEQGKLTPELKKQILAAETLVVVDDLYRPYRPKRRTRATIAKEKGLEPLANLIRLQLTKRPLEEDAKAFFLRKRSPSEPETFWQRPFLTRRITGSISVTSQ